jgi:hypothetical protein
MNAKGNVIEIFLALVHVRETTTDSINTKLFGVLDRHKLFISHIWG